MDDDIVEGRSLMTGSKLTAKIGSTVVVFVGKWVLLYLHRSQPILETTFSVSNRECWQLFGWMRGAVTSNQDQEYLLLMVLLWAAAKQDLSFLLPSGCTFSLSICSSPAQLTSKQLVIISASVEGRTSSPTAKVSIFFFSRSTIGTNSF